MDEKRTEFLSIQDNVVPIDPQPLIPDIDTPNMSRRSGRVIGPPFMITLIGESSLTIFESHEDDSIGYYEEINDKDFEFWKEVMK